MQIVVYTRYDCAELDPEVLAITFGHVPEANDSVPRPQPTRITLYNNTGQGFTGYHYDPVFPASGTMLHDSHARNSGPCGVHETMPPISSSAQTTATNNNVSPPPSPSPMGFRRKTTLKRTASSEAAGHRGQIAEKTDVNTDSQIQNGSGRQSLMSFTCNSSCCHNNSQCSASDAVNERLKTYAAATKLDPEISSPKDE
eukprot:11222702-Karenia_brevis.AAC.1